MTRCRCRHRCRCARQSADYLQILKLLLIFAAVMLVVDGCATLFR